MKNSLIKLVILLIFAAAFALFLAGLAVHAGVCFASAVIAVVCAAVTYAFRRLTARMTISNQHTEN